MGGREETLPIVVRACGMEVPPSTTLEMSGSVHLTFGYLLKSEHKGLGVIVLQLIN